jgi:hypothetical protein
VWRQREKERGRVRGYEGVFVLWLARGRVLAGRVGWTAANWEGDSHGGLDGVRGATVAPQLGEKKFESPIEEFWVFRVLGRRAKNE